MVIFHSYVSLPEGTFHEWRVWPLYTTALREPFGQDSKSQRDLSFQ